jgi:hypothetical protein
MEKTKEMCRGCRDDFYNHNRECGCWCFEDAKIVERIQVGVWEPPPYSIARKQKVLACFTRQGYAMISTTDCRVKNELSRQT